MDFQSACLEFADSTTSRLRLVSPASRSGSDLLWSRTTKRKERGWRSRQAASRSLSSRARRNDYRCGVRESSQDLFWSKQNSPEKISGLRVFDFPDYRLRSR